MSWWTFTLTGCWEQRRRKIDSELILLSSEDLANIAGEDTSVEAEWDNMQRSS
jgi:hypothetical protein